jgi:hypothetical protein
MDFYSVRCELCKQDKFKEFDVYAFQVRFLNASVKLEQVDLNGRQPWSGVRCICNDCVLFVDRLHA